MRVVYYTFSLIDIIAGLIIILSSDLFLGNIGKVIGILILLKGLYSLLSIFVY